MKYIYLLLLITFSLNITYGQVQNYNVGDVVDDFTLTDIEGNTHNLYEYTAAGKYVYLDFFFTTCGPCQSTAPIYNEFFDKYGCGAGDVMCISVNRGTDNDAQVEEYDNTHGGSFNHAPIISSDGGAQDVRINFGITAYPTICLINPENQIIKLDIWPVSGVETFENTFPAEFDPTPIPCTLGINEITSEGDFSIFPNPSTGGIITISLQATSSANVSISNILGKEVFQSYLDNQNNSIQPNLAPGSYFVQVNTDKGTNVKKLIVK